MQPSYISIIKKKTKNGGALKAWISNQKNSIILNEIDLYCIDLIKYNLVLFEKIWHYINQIDSPQLCECNKLKKFNTINKGWHKTCGNKSCMNQIKIKNSISRYGVEHPMKSKLIVNKVKQTNFKKYGVENYAQTDEYKEKLKNTSLKNFGVEHPMKSSIIKNKIKSTNLERYGVEHVLQSKNIQRKIVESNLKTYGVENVFQSEKIKDRIKDNNIKKYGVEHNMQRDAIKAKYKELNENKFLEKCRTDSAIIFANFSKKLITYKCDSCGHESQLDYFFYWQRTNKSDITPCIKCVPLKEYHGFENSIEQFLIDNNITNYIKRNRNILKPKELDFYFPDLHVAIEANGVYWHNELFKEKKYHLIKSDLALEQNIKLIHIWEDDWEFKQDIIKSRLLNILNRTSIKIFARKCNVKEITAKESRLFLNENHLQGYVASSIKIGLFYNDELVSLMTFGRPRKALNSITSANDSYEMYRFCSKLNMNIVGGASKLFKYFLKKYDPIRISTFFDRAWGKSNVYEQLGFNFMYNTGVNYWYIIDGKKSHRFNWTKHKLVESGYDKNMTEVAIMHSLGRYRLFGPGNEKWIWEKT